MCLITIDSIFVMTLLCRRIVSFKNDVLYIKTAEKGEARNYVNSKKREILLQLLTILRSKVGLPLIIVVLTIIGKNL